MRVNNRKASQYTTQVREIIFYSGILIGNKFVNISCNSLFELGELPQTVQENRMNVRQEPNVPYGSMFFLIHNVINDSDH